MGGRQKLSGYAAPPPVGSLPYVILELGTPTPWYYNVWRVIDGVPTRLSNFQFDAGPSEGQEPELSEARLSDDGNWVATVVNWQDESPFAAALYVVPAFGGTHINVWDDAGDEDFLIHASWHPDNDYLLFIYGPHIAPSYDYGLGGSIYRIQRTNPGATPTLIWEPDIQSPFQREGAYRPHYSPDGTKIAFFVDIAPGGGGDFTRQGLWVVNADGSGELHLQNWESGSSAGGYLYEGTQLAWSHDSEWIAYVQGDFGGNGNLGVYKIRPDGTDNTLVKAAPTAIGCRITYEAWLDDDSAMIITASPGGIDSDWRIYSVLSDGSGTATELVSTDGPAGGVASNNWRTCYRNWLTNRIEWISETVGGHVSACDIDGSNQEIIHDITTDSVGDDFYAGTGFEWS